MATAICYNLIYNESTSAFEKHGSDTITSANFTLGTITGVSGICTSGHHLYFDVTEGGELLSVVTELNLSADFSVTSANDDMLPLVLTSADSQTSGTPDTSATDINEVNNMKVEIVIEAISPVIKTGYSPIEKTKPTDVVTR